MLYSSIDIHAYAYYSQAWTVVIDAPCSPPARDSVTIRAAGCSMSVAETMRRRIRTVGIALAVLALGVLTRYGALMLAPGESAQSAVPTARRIRGPILDRHGRLLAVQIQLDTVTAWTPAITEPDRVAATLATVLGLDAQALAERIRTRDGFLIVQRTIEPDRSAALRTLIRNNELTGIRLEPDTARIYPHRDAAAALIGYVSVDNVGLAGIEYLFGPDLLSGEGPGVGNQVFLTIDLAIQEIADRIAGAVLEREAPDRVMILVADADNGDLLAVSSLPSFDPNRFRDYSDEERRNFPVAFIYEPGSAFKVFSVAAMLELGGIDLNDTFDTTGGYVRAEDNFSITDLADYGVIDARGIIRFSSNVGVAYASETVSDESFYAMLRRFGFGEPTHVDLGGEERGLLAPVDRWSKRSRQTLAMGHEIGVTAMQMIAAATTLSNDGVLLRPQVVRRIVAEDGSVLRRFQREPVGSVLSAQTARTMLDLMVSTTGPGGTARAIDVPGITVAAKSGTAEVFDAELGRYSTEHVVASTLALFPASDPELIVYVAIDYPRGGSIYGGRIAAPVVDEIIEMLAPYVGAGESDERTAVHPGSITPAVQRLPPLDGVVPDFTGLAKRTLLPLLAVERLAVDLIGSGWVVRQFPEPGTVLEPGLELTLWLE